MDETDLMAVVGMATDDAHVWLTERGWIVDRSPVDAWIAGVDRPGHALLLFDKANTVVHVMT